MSEDATLDEFIEHEESTGKERRNIRLGPVTASFPEDWSVQKMDSLYREKSIGTNERGTGEQESIPLVKMGDLKRREVAVGNPEEEVEQSDEMLDEYRLEKGDFLFNTRNTPDLVGKTAVWDSGRPAVYDNNLLRVRFKSDITPLFVNYFLSSGIGWRQARGHVHGTTSVAAIYDGEFDKLQIPVPGAKEQHRIASVLYNVDQAIQKTEELINQAERVKLGLAQDLLNDGINDEPKVETDSRFGPIPESWELHPLKEVGEIAGRTAPEKDESECWGGDIPWATPSEITSLEGPTISDTEEHLTEVALEKVSSNLLPPESVLLTTRATIGECAVNTVEMTTNQGFKSLIPGDRLDTWYAYYRLKYEGDYLASLSKGSTFPEVGKDTVENFVIPVPRLEEQKEIGERLKSVDDMVLSYKSNKNQLQRLKRGLMQDLLSGTVRTTDTNIEVLPEVAQHG